MEQVTEERRSFGETGCQNCALAVRHCRFLTCSSGCCRCDPLACSKYREYGAGAFLSCNVEHPRSQASSRFLGLSRARGHAHPHDLRQAERVDLPWPNATVKVNGLAVLPDKRSIFFADPASAVDKAGIFRASGDGHSAVELMGASTLQSNYGLLSAEVNADPIGLPSPPWGRKADGRRFLAIPSRLWCAANERPSIRLATGAASHRITSLDDNSAQSLKPIGLDILDSKDRSFRPPFRLVRSTVDSQPEITAIDSVYTLG